VDSVLFKPFNLEEIHETVDLALTGGSALPRQHFGEVERGE
jgi:hypothetical protein